MTTLDLSHESEPLTLQWLTRKVRRYRQDKGENPDVVKLSNDQYRHFYHELKKQDEQVWNGMRIKCPANTA